MFSKSTIAATLLLAASATAQTTSAASVVATSSTTASPAGTVATGQTAATGSPSINAASLVDALIPTASLTTIPPAQQTQLESDALAYFNAYTMSNPISKLLADAVIDQLLAASDPSPQQTSALVGLLENAESGLLANPTAYVASVEAAISPFAVAPEVSTYAGNLLQGLRTVVASDLSLSLASATGGNNLAATQNAAAHAAFPTGAIGAAAAAAAVCAALL